ncbi:Domain of unknown function DUF4371 [Cinara cedri]|uniref:DUF4371 domain-containing protein n=1 Tax=Cinara cedri TaxID=506608 RepID=A0A5E4NNJ1_9HEMI|nr:Domain of unknown function DUF4371 [Cinara cedri]
MKPIIQTIRFCGRQPIGLQGHENWGRITMDEPNKNDVKDVTGLGLVTTLQNALEKLSFNLDKLRGQGYDGAAAMRGSFRGVQVTKLESLCETRWDLRHELVLIFKEFLESTVAALEQLQTEGARGTDLTRTNDLSAVHKPIETITLTFQKMRENCSDVFGDIYNESKAIATLLNADEQKITLMSVDFYMDDWPGYKDSVEASTIYGSVEPSSRPSTSTEFFVMKHYILISTNC